MPAEQAASVVQRLCLQCGLCCDGTLFKDVELQPGDSAKQLESLNVTLQRLKAKVRFPQPCECLGRDLRCRIYADRPVRCRQFECGQLKAVLAGEKDEPAALRVVRSTRQKADQVRRLMRELGDPHEHMALSVRFRRLQRRLERGFPDEASAARFADLTLAVHDLNLLLHREFLAVKPASP